MKKIYLPISFAALSLAFTQSCIKGDLLPEHHAPDVKQQTVSAASVAENASYTYSVPVVNGATSEITADAGHAKVSAITTDANGNLIYRYTPAANYVGNDAVTITTHSTQANASGCFGGGGCNHNGNCNGHGKDDQTVITTINLTVTPSSVIFAKPASEAGTLSVHNVY